MAKKALLSITVLIALGVAGFFYATRPLQAPSDALGHAESTPQESITVPSSAPVASDNTQTDQQPGTEPLSSTTPTPFHIVSDQSEASFSIFEVLRGNDFTAVGTTRDVTGDISINTAKPEASTMGTIRINARTLKTDNERRDGAISRFILHSDKDEYEFIEFKPTNIEGLPTSITVGTPYTLSITGDLSIAGTTQSVTFNATSSLTSKNQFTGNAQTTIKRSDFHLTVPSLPFLANVSDDVTLKISFVAQKNK